MQLRFTSLVLLSLLLPAALAGPARAEKKEEGTYVSIETVAAATLGGGRHQIVTMQAGVDVPDKALHDYAEKVTPRLRDAYTQVLQLYAGSLVPGAPPDPDYLAGRMQEATDRVLRKSGGKFLIGGIMVN